MDLSDKDASKGKKVAVIRSGPAGLPNFMGIPGAVTLILAMSAGKKAAKAIDKILDN